MSIYSDVAQKCFCNFWFSVLSCGVLSVNSFTAAFYLITLSCVIFSILFALRFYRLM